MGRHLEVAWDLSSPIESASDSIAQVQSGGFQLTEFLWPRTHDIWVLVIEDLQYPSLSFLRSVNRL